MTFETWHTTLWSSLVKFYLLNTGNLDCLDNRLLETTSTLNTCRRSGRLGLLERQLQVGISDI